MLKIEVIRFDAQDVITASATAECICKPGDGNWHWQNVAVEDHGDCPASEHPNCTAIN